MEYIAVAEVLKAQGIMGEIKTRSLSDDPLRCKKLKVVYINNVPYKIESCRVNGQFVYFKLAGINTRDDAQCFAGKLLSIDSINSVELKKDSYFIKDLVGCRIETADGIILGNIKNVDQFGAADVITGKASTGKEFRFPFLKKLIVNIDVAEKLFVVDKSVLEEVCVYDD